MSPSFLVKALRGALVLIALVLTWCVVLWWLIAPDFASLRLTEVTILHAGPPLLFWSGWRFWLGHHRQRQTAAEKRQVELAEQERQTALAEAKSVHMAEQRRVRFGCDCRALATTQLIAADEAFADSLAGNNVAYVSMQASENGALVSPLLDHLGPGIDEALSTLFERCPAALAFPIYVVAPNGLSGEEVVDRVRQCRSTLGAMRDGRAGRNTGTPEYGGTVCFLPRRDNAADSVIGLFENQPDLPGAVVLAFDSPFWRSHHGSSSEDAGLDAGDEAAPPAQGVVALVVTHPDFAEMITALPADEASRQLVAPHWEKSANRLGMPAGFSGLSAMDLESLAQTRPLARIHRAASAAIKSGGSRRQELVQCLEMLIERAQINSAQIDVAFSASVDVDEGCAALANERSGCGWLVHNAGGSTIGGQQLASLGAALLTRGLEVEPIDEATNVSQALGDLGCARELVTLALTVTHAAIAGRNVLCADFCGDDQVSVFFAAVSPEHA